LLLLMLGPGSARADAEEDWVRLAGPAPLRGEVGELGRQDLERAAGLLAETGFFFGKLAETDPNSAARLVWQDARLTYRAAGRQLKVAAGDGRVALRDLSAGTAIRTEAGRILVDRDLAGAWKAEEVRAARRNGDDWPWIAKLAGLVLGEWLALEPRLGRGWDTRHAQNAGIPDGRPRVTRYWYLKDQLLRAGLLAAGGRSLGQETAWTARTAAVADQVPDVLSALAPDIGPAAAERLSADWTAYRRTSGRTAERRSWLLLAPRIPAAVTALAPPEETEPEAPQPEQDEPVALDAALAEAKRENAELTARLEAAERRAETARSEAAALRTQAAETGASLAEAQAEAEGARSDATTKRWRRRRNLPARVGPKPRRRRPFPGSRRS
jgi:hypothetical protein